MKQLSDNQESKGRFEIKVIEETKKDPDNLKLSEERLREGDQFMTPNF